MQIAFYGIARQIGTSANMAAVAAGFTQYMKMPVTWNWDWEHSSMNKHVVCLSDCKNKLQKEQINHCSLLVLNLILPQSGMEKIFLEHSFVHRNVVFLIGKYHPNQSKELEQVVLKYRIDDSRICTIPYNIRFQKAYENGTVLDYIRSCRKTGRSCEDFLFEKHLKQVIKKILIYGTGKGEQSYG